MIVTTDAVGSAAAQFQFDVITSLWADVGFRHTESFAISDNANVD